MKTEISDGGVKKETKYPYLAKARGSGGIYMILGKKRAICLHPTESSGYYLGSIDEDFMLFDLDYLPNDVKLILQND